jgi:sulfite exporter TauE/SafE/copper chaperone CopZ
MGQKLTTKTLYIEGMTCTNCESKIRRKLSSKKGIKKAEVSFSKKTALVTYDASVVTLESILELIEKLGYTASGEAQAKAKRYIKTAGILCIIGASFLLLEYFGILNLLTPGETATADMSLGMLFIIGILTSVHCVAMCGGINLSQCIPQASDEKKATALLAPLLYNAGRVVSYTAVGFLVGALGSVLTFSTTVQGVLKLIAGVLMIVMGLNMLGILPGLNRFIPRLPKKLSAFFQKGTVKIKSSFVVGLLNGLMPCGPLQAMQIYALSTGNPFIGAASMFLFSLGTVPLMFLLGALGSLLSRKFTKGMMTVGAALVVVLGLSMLNQGGSLAGISVISFPTLEEEQVFETQPVTGAGDVQEVYSALSPYRYPSITVTENVPVRWVIDVPTGTLNGCNYRIIIPEYEIVHTFDFGKNVIEFTPTKAGKYMYTCWMGMIRANINVIEA